MDFSDARDTGKASSYKLRIVSETFAGAIDHDPLETCYGVFPDDIGEAAYSLSKRWTGSGRALAESGSITS